GCPVGLRNSYRHGDKGKGLLWLFFIHPKIRIKTIVDDTDRRFEVGDQILKPLSAVDSGIIAIVALDKSLRHRQDHAAIFETVHGGLSQPFLSEVAIIDLRHIHGVRAAALDKYLDPKQFTKKHRQNAVIARKETEVLGGFG